MKEYIVKADFITEGEEFVLPDIVSELTRCKDCVWYGGDDDWSTCAITPEYPVSPNGYCHRAERKVNDDNS